MDKLFAVIQTECLLITVNKLKEIITFELKMTIKQAQEQVENWIKKYGVRYFDEMTNLAMLTEEVGELARIINRKYGEQSFKKTDSGELSDELADVLFVVICLANQTGVDLTQAFEKNLDKKSRRDQLRHRNNPKL